LVIAVSIAFLVLVERELLGGLQLRTGPVNLGKLQTVIDGVKLLTKGSNINIVGIIFIGSSFYLLSSSGLDMIFVLSVIAISFLSMVMGSENIYAKLRRLRILMLVLTFEIVIIILILNDGLLPLCILIFCFMIDGGRTPVDLVEGESELVSRFNTEFGGLLFTCFFIGEMIVLIVFFVLLLPWYGLIGRIFLLIITRGSWPRVKFEEVIEVF